MSSPATASDTTANVPQHDRPVTSKPRGICRYYNTSRGCYAGDRCKFLHGESERLTPYDKSKVCRFYASGWCRNGDKCWFIHVKPGDKSSSATSQPPDDDEDNLCSICYDVPVTFGLLVGCSHVFCLPCIKNWRGSEGKSADMIEAGTTKTCPMCRTSSRFVTPSSLFYPEGDPKKAQVIEQYKNSMARVKCKYFENSPKGKRSCPFGKECFYKHENEDGTPYVFERGADYYMQRQHSSRRHGDFTFSPWDHDDDSGVGVILATIAHAMRSANMNPRDVQHAVSTVVAALGVEDIYRLDEDNSDAEEERLEQPATHLADQSDAEQPLSNLLPWGGWPFDPSLEHHNVDITTTTTPDPPTALASPQPSAGTALDPTPAFIPSYLDSLRPLPSGPAGSSHPDEEQDNPDEGPATAHSSTSESTNSGEFAADCPLRQQPSGDSSAAATSAALEVFVPSAVQAEPVSRTEVAVHDNDPPFMTDGRGRVVWSSTTSSRARDGRRGRATSSSATILPHIKSSPDLSVAEETTNGCSQQDPPSGLSGRLLRQRSLPLVGPSTEVAQPVSAEFVTDGRGRVVFASNDG